MLNLQSNFPPHWYRLLKACLAFVDIFIFSLQICRFVFSFIFFSVFGDDTSVGRWRDEEEEEEELEEEVESPKQVDRVRSESKHESVYQGLCGSVHPSVHRSLCCLSMSPSSHQIFSQAKSPDPSCLGVQNLLSPAPFLPFTRECRE